MHYLQTESAHWIRNKCIKSKDHEMNTTCRPGVQSGESKSNGLIYTTVPGICVMVPIYERCSALIAILKTNLDFFRISTVALDCLT